MKNIDLKDKSKAIEVLNTMIADKEKLKKVTHDAFKAMDKNKNNLIEYKEFSSFMTLV